MASLDPTVASILDRNPTTGQDSDDEDALISALEDDSTHTLTHLREQRLQQLHSELSRAKAQRNSDYGKYLEIKDEKQLMEITTSSKYCVVHFQKPDFARCRYMDSRLSSLPQKHFDTRFQSINVENAPFLVAKLKIQVLPCVICFIDGVGTDRIVGFEGLGRKTDEFTLRELEDRLMRAGVLVRSKVVDEDERQNGRSRKQAVEDDYDDDEWD